MTTALTCSTDTDTDGSSPAESQELIVTSVRLEATDVISIVLADPSGAQLPAWQPGAHLELVLPSGLRRQYSLCGTPENRQEYRIAVRREENGRGGSRELHDTGMVGRRLTVLGPRNRFALVDSARYVFIAGGIGITPILAMVRAMGPEADWRLHYGGHTRAGMAFVGELLDISHDRVDLAPKDQTSRLDVDRIVAEVDDSTEIYCCGPAGLLDAVRQACEQRGCGARLHIERFGAAPVAPTAVPAARGADTAVEVELRRCGVTLQVSPEQSILDAILDVAPDTPFSCTEGYCGTCELKVLEGRPDHRDEILTDRERAEGNTMFPCVSRALSERLVLDV